MGDHVLPAACCIGEVTGTTGAALLLGAWSWTWNVFLVYLASVEMGWMLLPDDGYHLTLLAIAMIYSTDGDDD
jgi:hypothetical protein